MISLKSINLILIVTIVLLLQSCTFVRTVYYNAADIEDHNIFSYRDVNNSTQVFQFPHSSQPLILDSISLTSKSESYKMAFDDYLSENETVAFLVIKDDSVMYENYFNDYSVSSVVNSFSVTKSVVSILIGCAIDDGLIESIDQPVTDYLPALKKNGFDSVTISHLLDMRSGVKYSESYGAFSDVATLYYTRDLRREIDALEIDTPPGTETHYKSCDPQVLGLILEKVLKDKTISKYLEEKIWIPLGMEFPATWSLDQEDKGIEKTFCCLNARARDFAKIGRLYLNKGNWNGMQIVSRSWVESSTNIDQSKGQGWYYNNQWWINKDSTYYAQGILGQYIAIDPKNNTIIVRLGKSHGDKSNWKGLFHMINTELSQTKQIK